MNVQDDRWTDGASAVDVQTALAGHTRRRRDSQVGESYGGDNDGVFAGPGSAVVPSSVSRISHFRRSRRHSGATDISALSGTSGTEPDGRDDPDADIGLSTKPRHRASVFSQLFGGAVSTSPERERRRPSLSRRSSRGSRRSHVGSEHALDDEEDEFEERWGYSSGEEDQSIATDSLRDLPESPSSASLPLLSADQFFGDVRMNIDLDDFSSSQPAPSGPPSRQDLFMPDEDAVIRFVGFKTTLLRERLWRLVTFMSLGVVGLLGHWFPRLWLRWVAREKPFETLERGFVVVETSFSDTLMFPMHIVDYPYGSRTVFNEAEDEILGTLRYVDYRYARFVLEPRSGLFIAVRDWRDKTWSTVANVRHGLSQSVRKQRELLFGPNVIDIQGKPVLSLLIEEVIHPFYVFQIASIILWSLDDYYYYAFCIAIISIASIATTLIDTRRTMKRMREMSRFVCSVKAEVEGNVQSCESTGLVPGDIVHLADPELVVIPADMLILSGDAIVNESMLTGESVPVSKIALKDADIVKWRDGADETAVAKSFLYAGTKVVRIRSGDEGNAVGLVVRTGFNTTKGALVRSMLFPRPIGFKFYRDSMRFIAVLAGIAGFGFLVSAFRFVELGVTIHTMILRALDLITVVVPPALPATLSIGTSFALSRLRSKGVFCISPNRINVAGKVNVVCFDKTGTLTEDGLDVLGVRGLEARGSRFGELVSDVVDLQVNSSTGKPSLVHALATCHSLRNLEGEVIGDPLDVKMFEFTKWTLEEGLSVPQKVGKSKNGNPDTRPSSLVQAIVRPPGSAGFRIEDALKSGARHAHFLELGVIRSFEFVSALRRMSVVVKRLKSSHMEIYVKGAPEVMVDICDPTSFPRDYDDLLAYYTRRGYRVIALAGKVVEGLTWLKAQRLKREQVESGLTFLGLIIFENKLKSGTPPAIQTLRNAHLACRMITGDNPLTAVSVARECGLVSQSAHVYAPSFIKGDQTTPTAELSWTSMDDPALQLDDYSLKPLPPPPHRVVESDIEGAHDYTLAVPGDVFRWMIHHSPLETLQRMFARAQVFARMSPDEKNEVVERLQALGYTVLMCGDGANDCAALKAADVGLSLSEAEASVAAPFTSRTPDIGCVIEVIKEGRAALVTSFSCFKYMALYSLIQFTTITLLYSFASSLGDFQFLYIDLFIIIPIAVTMGRTLPFTRLHITRPTASLVSTKVLSSIIGQIIITSAAQFWAFLWIQGQPWYLPPQSLPHKGIGDKLETTNYENTALFLVSSFQYILVAVVFSIGPPYRQPMYTNKLLVVCIAILSIFSTLVLLAPPRRLMDVLDLMFIPFSARLALLVAVVINVLFSIAFERWGAPLLSETIGWLLRLRREDRRQRHAKAYQAIESRPP